MLQATSTAAPDSFLAEQLLKDNAKKIDEGKKEIDILRSTKPEGWQVELNYLSEELKQLREERLVLLRKLET